MEPNGPPGESWSYLEFLGQRFRKEDDLSSGNLIIAAVKGTNESLSQELLIVMIHVQYQER